MNEPAPASLRELPPVNEILDLAPVAPLIARSGRDRVRGWVRAAVTDLRERISKGLSNGASSRAELTAMVLQLVRQQATDDSSRTFGGVINATGVVLHTSLGRSPLSAAAVAAIGEAAAGCNLEVDLDSGQRRSRGHQ